MKTYNESYDASKDANYTDQFYIGEIDFEDELINEQEIGSCKVEVYGKEGNILHFHIIGINSNFETCICIYSANYFSHGEKYKDIFNNSQINILIKWLNKLNPIFNAYTNWEVISKIWEGSNPDCKFPDNRKTDKQPDYLSMIQFKDD